MTIKQVYRSVGRLPIKQPITTAADDKSFQLFREKKPIDDACEIIHLFLV